MREREKARGKGKRGANGKVGKNGVDGKSGKTGKSGVSDRGAKTAAKTAAVGGGSIVGAFGNPAALSAAAANPDVLSCIANLSSDEVFTPPNVANAMLDMLPQRLFSDPKATFLDPACKSGVFLREIAKRLMAGLADKIPDEEERRQHIFREQLFGIAITEMTGYLSRRSVYCSRVANGEYSIAAFKEEDGNVRFAKTRHKWEKGKCKCCGAAQEKYERDEGLESHAYEFIHRENPEEIFKMKFDVIISNPPYQLSDGGAQASASPIFQLFVQQAMKLKPRYLTMIIPARWYAGGKGLDDFRAEMIADRRIRVLHDFLNADECFGSGVEIKGGVCYFLWDRDKEGTCDIFTHNNGNTMRQAPRNLKEDGCDVFIRYGYGVSVYNKVRARREETIDSLVSSRKPFGLATTDLGHSDKNNGDILIYQRGEVAYLRKSMVSKNSEWINQYKVLISKAYGAGETYPHQILGRPIVAEKNSCCNETYLVIGPFKTRAIAENVASYIATKFFRFLVLLLKNTQDATKSVYQLVPQQDFTKPWTDEELYKKYKLTKQEIGFIESMIRPMGEDAAAEEE